ncbi:hypothetical protein [Streptomyces chartreusis]|uniref:LPXTG cell wall anchor domain-containing protein n=1 Tax=Streptomyces chartreusis TaxID=1969 RepID=A0A7I0Y8U4_STRCX|nr:hypothetical protein [Streptomyces chartreusis]QKZ15925.1 hypothetical protein HUT05_09255 [Streptomyces chartreusis]
MRRTARALSVAALTGVALGAPASAASADPAAEVSPGTVAPGGSVTVSVTCDALDGSAPATLQATSQAFEEGTVELKRVSGTGEKAAGAVYRGSARVPPAESFEGDPDAAGAESDWTVDGTCPAAGGGEGKEWSATFTVARESGGTGSGGAGSVGGGSDSDPTDSDPTDSDPTDSDATDSVLTDSGVSDLSANDSGGGKGSDAGGKGEESGGHQGGSGGTGGGHTCKDPESDWTGAEKAEPYAAESEAGKAEPGWDGAETEGTGGLGGTDTGGLGEEGLDTGGTDTGGTGAGETGGTDAGGTDASGIAPEWDTGAGKKEPGAEDCAGATDQHGVQAGTGGTFTDSVPALVAGGVLIAGAFGGAAYRLRRRTTTPED